MCLKWSPTRRPGKLTNARARPVSINMRMGSCPCRFDTLAQLTQFLVLKRRASQQRARPVQNCGKVFSEVADRFQVEAQPALASEAKSARHFPISLDELPQFSRRKRRGECWMLGDDMLLHTIEKSRARTLLHPRFLVRANDQHFVVNQLEPSTCRPHRCDASAASYPRNDRKRTRLFRLRK